MSLDAFGHRMALCNVKKQGILYTQLLRHEYEPGRNWILLRNQGMDNSTSCFLRKRNIIRYLTISLVVLCTSFFSAPAISGAEISILLMPIESKDEQIHLFSIDDPNYSSYLVFDNTSQEWEGLELNKQGWICEQLLDFAQTEKVKVNIRFVSWARAFYEITAHGQDYDVVQVPSTWTAYLSEKLLVPFMNNPDLSHFPDTLVQTCRPENSQKIYAIPWQIDLRVLYVRQELTQDPSTLTTFEDFSQCLKNRKESQIDKRSSWKAPLGISLKKDWNILHDTFRYFFGGTFLEKKEGGWKVAFMRNEALEGINKLIQLRQDELVYFDSGDNRSMPDWKVMAQGLVDGRYDAVFGGLYMSSVFERNPECTIYAVSLPDIHNKPAASFLGGSHLGMTSVKGRKLIEHLTADKIGVEMYKATVAVPANTQALKKFFTQYPRWNSLDIEKILKSAQPYPSISQWVNIIENQTGLDKFYNALESISNRRDFYEVSAELDAAAREIQHEIIKKGNSNGVWFIIIILLTVVILIVLVSMTRKIETIKGGIKDVKVYMEKEFPYITSALESAKKQISGQFESLEGQISPLFSSISAGFDEIENTFQHLETEVRSANNKLSTLDDTRRKIKEIKDDIQDINSITGTSNNYLIQVGTKLDDIVTMLGPIYKKAAPANKVPLDRCELQADFGYDFVNEAISLELNLVHKNQTLKSCRFENHKLTSLFELLIIRQLLYNFNQSVPRPGLNLSDYIFVRQYKAALEDPKKDTAQTFIARFREDICLFVSSHCVFTVGNNMLSHEDFMIKAEIGTFPKYEFMLHKQMSFKCNIIDFVSTLPAITDQNVLIDELYKCPRSIDGWEKLIGFNLVNLTSQQEDFIQKAKAMLIKEKNIYDCACSICQSPGGQKALDIYQENSSLIPQLFGAWAAKLDNIITNL